VQDCYICCIILALFEENNALLIRINDILYYLEKYCKGEKMYYEYICQYEYKCQKNVF